MEKTEGRPVQALLTGLSKMGFEVQPGDTVFFGKRRDSPTLEEMEAKLEAIKREVRDHEAARKVPW